MTTSAPETAVLPEDHPFREANILLNGNRPLEAIHVARKSLKTLPKHWSVYVNLGGLFIDAGGAARKPAILREGVALLEKYLSDVPDEYLGQVTYNLANGYLALGQRERGESPGTKPSLGRAIDYLYLSCYLDPTPQARINLASALIDQGRYPEATDELLDVLAQMPHHPVALGKLATAYWYIWSYSQRHRGLLHEALRLYREAEANSRDVPLYNETFAFYIRDLLSKHDLDPPPQLTEAPMTTEQRWIWESGLNLNLCPYCRIETPDAFDTSVVGGWLKGPRRRPPLKDVQDLVNSLHRGYSAARWNLMQGMGVVDIPLENQVVTAGGNADSQNGLDVGLVIASISGFYSILGQVAYALNSYLRLGHPENRVDFWSVWNRNSSKRSVATERNALHRRISRFAHPSINALYQLALSMDRDSGIHADLREIRNSLEHHVVVPRLGITNSKYFRSYDPVTLGGSAIQLGRFARAAILYFGSVVWQEEHRRVGRTLKKGELVSHGEHTEVLRL